MAENTVLTEGVYLILLSLKKPLHGYGIIKNVQEKTNGRVNLAAGTLYGALNNLLSRGWIKELASEESSRKKEYIITSSGEDALMREYSRLRELVMITESILEG
ncbi:MAG: PadR family transcriptional regulator [Anaerofustis stercorihominis]|nr:PadR family transcriptional regulator [Anaerofustis stercorihominis]